VFVFRIPRPGRARAALAALVTVALLAPAPLAAQHVDRELVQRGRRMLEQLRKDLKTYYYDSTYHGIDIDAKFAQADSAIQAAPTPNHVMAALADYLLQFRDSHTWFIPPNRVADVDYGFRSMFVGDTSFITSVRKGSDAEKQGLKRGDALLMLDRFKVDRKGWDLIQYVYFQLSPRERVKLQVKPVGAEPREVVVQAKVTTGAKVVDLTDMEVRRRLIVEYEDAARAPTHFYRSFGDSVIVWRMPQFIYGDEQAIDEMLKRVRGHRALILDLRNNPGGSVDTQLYLAGSFLPFGDSTHVFTMKKRKGDEVLRARNRGREIFTGRMVVLVNSNSASAAEITARILQIEGRGTVVGDRSAGAVVTSLQFTHEVGGVERVMQYGASISVADVIMPDGNRLENIGVTPDVVVLPTGEDIAAKRDPQMAKALEIVGMKMTPAEASLAVRKDD
jgi:C-terminal processing protease CtpA/Prc